MGQLQRARGGLGHHARRRYLLASYRCFRAASLFRAAVRAIPLCIAIVAFHKYVWLGLALGGAVQARPRLESAWFQKFNLLKVNLLFQLEPGF